MTIADTGADTPATTAADRLSRLACDAAGVLLVIMTVLIGVEILVRSVSSKSTLVADEYSGYLFAWITMLGFGRALQSGAFLRVDNLVHRLGPRGRSLADLGSAVAGMAVAAVGAYATGILWLASVRFGTVSIQPSGTPLWMPQLILPLGFLALIGVYAGLFGTAWKHLRKALPE